MALVWLFFAASAASVLYAADDQPDAAVEEISSDVAEQFDDAFDEDFDLFEDDADLNRVVISDPLEPMNRAIFAFNDKVYFWVAKPVARGYKAVVPAPARMGVNNFFDNLEFPVRFVNCMLQGKIKGAGTEVARFSLNSTIGVLGLFDPAHTFFALEPRRETLGQTLGVYGIGNGIYLVIPFLGPSTVRDAFGRVGDGFLKPVNYIQPYELSLAVSSYRYINLISFRIGDYEAVKDAAIDPYNAFKDAYLQYQKHNVEE